MVDDFQYAAATAGPDMTDLIERWPAETVQLVLASRYDPPLRQHRLRISGQLTEIRDRDLYFSVRESHDLLANFGVQISDADLSLLHERSEGWPAVLQMAALSLRSTDPARLARAIEVRGPTIADYFISEVLEQQAPEVAQFMLDTSILAGVLTADACAAVTGRRDTSALLRAVNNAHLFLTALDEEQMSFRYHQLVRRILRAELRARDRDREQVLQQRAAEWFDAAGDVRRAAYHYLAAQQPDRALTLLQDRVVPDFLHNPSPPAPLPITDPSPLVDKPERLLGLAADMLLSGETARGGEYLDLLEHAGTVPPDSALAARLASFQSFRYGVTGQLEKAVQAGLAAEVSQERTQVTDEWNTVASLVLIRVYNSLGDYAAAERQAAAALAAPDAAESVKAVLVPGARALATYELGYLDDSEESATSADSGAQRLGFDQHFFAVDHLRALSGLAAERRDFDAAERYIERVLSIAEQRRPLFEFLALLDRARIWAARGLVRDALATIETARKVASQASAVLLAQADELEALLRLSLGDLRSPAELARHLTAARRSLLLARVALAAGDHQAARALLQEAQQGELTPRQELVHRLLLSAIAIERGDPAAAGMLGGALHTARHQGFLNTVITTAPQVAEYVVEHAAELRSDPFTDQLVVAAIELRGAQLRRVPSGQPLAEPLTAAERRILTLLPTSTYLQMADTLRISRNTVKTHLRSIYQKLGVTSRPEALKRAVDLHLL